MKVVECDKNDARFTGLKNEIYEGVKWASFPEPQNEFLESCFIVLKEDKTVARAALFVNPAIAPGGDKMAQVGSFEAFKDPEAVELLFETLEARALAEGFKGLIGPMNGSTWNAYRFNCHQKRPFFTERYHPEYYPGLWLAAGFKKLAGYHSSISREVQTGEFPVVPVPEGIRLRNIRLDDYEKELEKIHRFCMEAFASNFLFSPIAVADFKSIYAPLQKLINPKLVIMAEEAGELVGLMFCLPDRYSHEGHRAIIKTLARRPGAAYAGLGQLLTNVLYREAQASGYRELVHAFMMDEGKAGKISGNFFGKRYRNYALFVKE